MPRWVAPLLIVATVAAVVLGFLLTRGAAQTEDDNVNLQGTVGAVEGQRDAAVGQSVDLAIQVQQACAAGELEPADRLCVRAAEVRAQPIPGARGPAGEPGPGPTPEQLRVAVAEYLIANPPRPGPAPSTADVAAAVSAYLTANPVRPGRAPTAEEIAAAVATYFASNPVRDGQDGDDGGRGEPGRAPTAQEIRAAVQAELAANPPPAGRDGDRGATGPTCPDGSSLQSVTYRDGRAGLGCVLAEQPQPTAAPPTPAPVEPEPEPLIPGGLGG